MVDDFLTNDPRTVDELINTALTEPDEDIAWYAVCALHWRGTLEVLQRASSLCSSCCSRERRLGADILGQLGVPDRAFPDRCIELLYQMISQEQDSDVLQSITIALTHLYDPNIVSIVAPLVAHFDPNVRQAVAVALAGHDDQESVHMLVHLTEDADVDVRDWATFALGSQTEADLPEIREALVRRLDDSDETVRGEALVGLARRKEQRVVAALIKELRRETVSDLACDAAELIAPKILGSDLTAIAEWLDTDPVIFER